MGVTSCRFKSCFPHLSSDQFKPLRCSPVGRHLLSLGSCSMKPIRFVMVGGFLGGGKTTTIGRLARMFQAQGMHVGIVTNVGEGDHLGLCDVHSPEDLAVVKQTALDGGCGPALKKPAGNGHLLFPGAHYGVNVY